MHPMLALKKILDLSLRQIINSCVAAAKSKKISGFRIGIIVIHILLYASFPNAFKPFLGVILLSIFIFFFLYKNAFLSLYSIFFITLHFLYPGKYYTFQLFNPWQIRAFPFYSTGITEGYGITASDIVAMLLIIYLVRNINTVHQINLKKIWENSFVRLTIISWLLYICLSLYSSVNNSFFPAFSVVSLMQYSKVILTFFSTIILLNRYSNGMIVLSELSFGIVSASVFLAASQFITGISNTLQGERYFPQYFASEVAMQYASPTGVYLHTRMFALFLLLWGLVFFISHLQKNYAMYKYAIIICVSGIVISQSRTVWTIAICIGIILMIQQKTHILKMIQNRRLFIIRTLMLGSIILFTMWDRFSSLRYTFDNGSGAIRVRMIDEGINVLRNNYWFGYGIRTGVHTLYQYFPHGYIQDFPFDIHVGYIQMAIESGVIATFFFFLPFIWLFKKTLITTTTKKTQWETRLPILLSLTTIFLYYIVQPHGGRYELPLLGIFIAVLSNRHFNKL